MAHHVHGNAKDQLPLQGAVLCCTSLPQDVRIKLADVATQMGAVHKLDLTSDVTHLIVGSITTPKYRYVAKDRPDIKVVSLDWLEAVRQAWMEGDDVHLPLLDKKHKLGVFYGLKICVTGFENLERRSLISDTVVEQGAEYHGDLTKTVTHLIAAGPTGAKYLHAKLWQTQIVSWKWFEDSVRRGMALEESLYDPVMPIEEQGQGAISTVRQRVGLSKRRREGESQTTAEAGSRKLRRTASTRLHSQSQDMWQDLSTREDTLEPSETDQWQDEGEPKHAPQRRPSLEKMHVQRSDVFGTETNSVPDGVFSGSYVLIRGFPRDRSTRLQDFLEPHGATVVQSAADLETLSQHASFRAGYLLMPHAFDGKPMEPPDVPQGTEMVTEWWVERCIHSKKLFEPANDPLSTPLWDANIPDFAGLAICTTGFSGANFRQTAEAIKLMGATYEEKLVPSVSLLISGSDAVKKEKAYYAAKHGISVVSAGWLWECLKTKQKVGYERYLVKLPGFDAKEMIREPATSSPAPSDMMQRKSERFAKKSEGAPKRLSHSRHKHATPSLSLQANSAGSANASRKTGPFIHEGDTEVPTVEREILLDAAPVPDFPMKRSQPLQEISPNASPRKGSQSQEKSDESAELQTSDICAPLSPQPAALHPSPRSPRRSSAQEPQQPLPRLRQELTADLAALLHRQTTSRLDSAGSELPQKCKNRPLGRSASGIGYRPVSASAQSDHAGSPGLLSAAADAAADGFASFSKDALPPPSTQLGYETADAQAHRAMMEKRMKVSLHDESSGTRVASMGTVKDSFVAGGGDVGVGNRLRGRNRTKT